MRTGSITLHPENFCLKCVVLQFQGDTPSALGSHFDELMRHVNSLRNDTIEMVLTILRTLCKIGGQAQSTPAQQEVCSNHNCASRPNCKLYSYVKGIGVDTL